MKIGYIMQQGVDILAPPFNGPANHVREVVQELQPLGHTIRVLVRIDGQTWKTDNLETFEPVHVRWFDQGPIHWFERIVRRIQFELKLPYVAFFESIKFALACKQAFAGFDLLYERLSWMSYGGAFASRWMDIPLILEDNGDQLADLEAKGIAPQGLQRRLSIALTSRSVQQAVHTVSSGDGWRKQYIHRWQVDQNKVTVIENGTIVTRLLEREGLKSFRKFAHSEEPTTLVYLGGFYPWHGVPILLQAFARALETAPHLQLVLIGNGSGEDEAHQLAADLGLGNTVKFEGHLSPTAFSAVLANADIGLSPYCGWLEYSGLKIFDYKAAGMAVIASGEDGMPATLTHGKTGLIIPPCDEDALTSAILQLTSDLDRTWEMGREGRLEAEKTHQWEHTAQNLDELFTFVTKQFRQ